MEQVLNENLKIDWRNELQQINTLRNQFKQIDPQYAILTNGLFILSHELMNTFAIDENYFRKNLYYSEISESNFSENTSFEDVIRFIREVMIQRPLNHDRDHMGGALNYSIEGYKETMRDHENILKNARDLNNRSFFPAPFKGLGKDNKQKLISQAFTRFWDNFLEIIEPVLKNRS